MNIVDINRFEEKMREAERRLGITTDNGIPVIYERSTDTAGKLLASLIVVAILLTVLSRKVKIQIKGIDSFVSKFFNHLFPLYYCCFSNFAIVNITNLK